MNMTRRAADVIVERLISHAFRHVFTVAGESYLDVLDALYDAPGSLQIVTCRHEAAAANTAEACGKLSGRAGVAFVTRGPGLTHASIGVHTAMQDASPMVLFIGEISREDRYRRAFQEVDLAITFADLAKGVLQIDIPVRAGELVDRAFQLAESGRPGPVIVGLPEDVLALARAYGLAAWRVEKTADFTAALDAARAQDGPTLIELLTSIEDISPGRRLSSLN